MAIDRAKTLQVAQRYVDRKRFDQAIVEYQRLVTEDPTDARTRLKIGDLQARTGAYAEAISTYDEVGRYYASNGFALKAIAVYKQIRELIERHVPQLADRYGHILPKLAAIYTELGLVSDALAAYDEVATRLQKAGRDREAIEVFQRVVSLDPTNPLPLLRHAEACIRNADTAAAVASFWSAAQLLLKMGRPDDALRVLERVFHFRADSEYALAAAKIYLDRGTPQDGLQALSKLQVCFQANPHDLVTLEQLARAFTLIGQKPKAVEVRKEMARIAYELGQIERLREITAQLLIDAPMDEQVIALAELKIRNKTVPPEPIHDGEEIEELSVEDAEELVEDDFDEFDVAEIEQVKPAAKKKPEPVSRMVQAQRVALNDAEAFVNLRLYAKAIDVLRAALRDAPTALELRCKLRDVLAESGDRRGALTEMLTLARLYWEQGNTAGARQELAEILDVDAQNQAARQMLAHIASGKGVAEALVSYDIEAVGVERALSTSPPMEIEVELESIAPEDAGFSDEVQEALVEADFFVSRELFDDAKLVLTDQLSRTPGHPGVLQRLDALEARMAGRASDPGRISVAPKSDDTFAIAASLDSDDLASPALSNAPTGASNLVNVDEVFAKFKEGVRAQVSEADSATHYDLGVAYKEMGLLPDAIGEFELAARDPAFACTCHAMVGMIHEEKREYLKARTAFEAALATKRKTPEQALSLYYDLGDVCEKANKLPEALEYFRKAANTNSMYRDVTARVQKLERAQGNLSAVRDREKDYADDDDVDAAFDRLMETK